MRISHHKGVACIFAAVFMFLFMASATFAQEQRVYDDAGLFSDAEAEDLETKTAAAIAETGLDFVILTIDDAQGKTSMAYADDFYDENGFGTGADYSGTLFLINMDNREIYISTSGDAIRYLTDERINRVRDNAYTYATESDWHSAAGAFLEGATQYATGAVPDNQHNYNVETGEISAYKDAEKSHGISLNLVIISVLVGIAGSAVTCLLIKSRYRLGTSAYRYAVEENSDFTLTEQKDDLVNRSVTTRRIPKPSSSGGGGSSGRSRTHVSRSGRTHGGGGRKF